MDIGIATAVYHDIAVGTETGISGIQQAGNSQQSQYTSCHAGKEVKGCTLPVRRAERNGYRFGVQIRFANLRFRITFYFFVEISEQRSIGSQMLRHLSRSEKGTDLLFFRGRSLTIEVPFQLS